MEQPASPPAELVSFLTDIHPSYVEYAQAFVNAGFNLPVELPTAEEGEVAGVPKGAFRKIQRAAGLSSAPTWVVQYGKGQLYIVDKDEQSWGALMKALVGKWPHLQSMDFVLRDSMGSEVDEEALTKNKSAIVDLKVITEGKSFSKYIQTGTALVQLARQYLNVDISDSGPACCDDDFASVDIKADDKVFMEAADFDCSTYGQLLQHVSVLIKLHAASALNPGAGQETAREIIGPIMAVCLAVARFAGPKGYGHELRLSAEHEIEAKRWGTDEVWAQVVMELTSTRDAVLRSLELGGKAGRATPSNKRNHWEAIELQRLPTFAVVCTASSYRLVAFTPPAGADQRGKLVKSNDYAVLTTPTAPLSMVKSTLALLVPKLTWLVVQMMEAVDRAKETCGDLQLLSVAGNPGRTKEEEEDMDD